MQIRPYTADDVPVLTSLVDLENAVGKVDAPWQHPETQSRVEGQLRHGWDGETPTSYGLFDGQRLVGNLQVHTSEWDNTDLAWLDVVVHPDERGRGHGSALMEHAFAEVRRLGRTKLGIDAWDAPGPDAFARRHGFERKSSAINRRQYVDQVDADVLRRLHAEAESAAADYELVRIKSRTPADMLDAVAEMTAAINDAPLDDLEIEDEVFTSDRVAAYEKAQLASGKRLYRLIARHRRTGALAGHTVVVVEEERPQIGHQHDTSVVREHRGHRIGLLLKSAMLLWLAEDEPPLATVDTWNAQSNDYMIAVNDRLGYRVLGRGVQYQRRLGP
jgi:GNAT superfamily N-acetyltransferase